MSSDNRKTRPILPRASLNDNPGPTTSESSPTSVAPRSTTYPNTRTNIRSACLACRRRRSRCSGGNPCNRCRALETECTYNETSDGRTRALRDRSREELELHKKVIAGVFRAVREGREQGILELIRNESSLEHIAAAIDDSNIETRSETASETAETVPSPVQEQTEEGSSTQPDTYSRDSMQFGDQHFPRSNTLLIGEPSWRIGQPSASGMMMHELLRYQNTRDMVEVNHTLELRHLPDDSNQKNLGAVYLQFRDATKAMIAQGVSPAQILGTSAVSCTMLFTRQSGSLSIATWAPAVLHSLSGPDILFKLAWLCYVTRFLRWAVDGTKESFDLMPKAMVPTALQATVPHPPVIDLIPIPQIRDQMILNFRDFTAALAIAGATVHWTESIEDAYDRDPSTGNMFVSSRFENHISNIENLCFGRSLLHVFPDLEGELQLAEVDQIVSGTTDESHGPWDMESDPDAWQD